MLACKIIKLENWEEEDLKNEIAIMSFCKHKNIVSYIETLYFDG